jgi:GT2 family glycosyltransferase
MTGTVACIVMRVFNRIEDLQICIDIIKKYWVRGTYYIVVVGNRKSEGFPIPEAVRTKVNKVVELDQNLGHREGNAQLVLEGIPHIPDTCQYTVLLEADTWVFTDEVVHKYIHLLDSRVSIWASSEWIEKYWSLGLDFALVRTSYIKHNKVSLLSEGKDGYTSHRGS